MFLVTECEDEDKQQNPSLISNSFLSIANRSDSIGHASASIPLGYHYKHLCSATAPNVNVPFSSLKEEGSREDVLCSFKQFFSIPFQNNQNPSDFGLKGFKIQPGEKIEEGFVDVKNEGKLLIGNLIRKYFLQKVFIHAVCSNSVNETVSIEKSGDNFVKNLVKLRTSQTHQQSTTSTDSSLVITTPVSSPSSSSPEVTVNLQEGSKMKDEMRNLEFILKSLVSGGVAGMCAKTAVAPLDRMKILLQAHSKHYSHLGVFSGLRGIVQKEKFIALYKGNGAQMVRIFPYAATQFTSFEIYKKLMGEDSHIARFSAGSAAGVTAVALTYPLDTIRARLAFQVTGEHVYNGIYSCAVHIFRQEGGIRALYRGFTPTVCGMVPYAGLSFYCFESFKYLCMKYMPTYTCKSHSTNTGGLVLLLYAKLICGGVAGAAAQTVAYPLDVTRRRMQLAMMDEKTKKFGMGMVSTIKLIYQENGVYRGLYRGMSINYLRAIPMVAVSFSTYELVKQMLKLDTGLVIKTG